MKKSPGLKRPSPSASVNARVALPPPSGGPRMPMVVLSRTRTACTFDRGTKAPTEVTSRRVDVADVVMAIFTGVATGIWVTNIRGRNTTARGTMKTMPATMEYRRSFVAWGGGLRLRLKTAVGLRGRAMRIDSLHVNRGTPRDRAVALLRGVPATRIVGAEHFDPPPQFLREEVGILSQHRELVHGAETIPVFDPCVSQLVRDLLRVCGHLLRPLPHPGLCQGLLHQDVHREGPLSRETSRDLVDAELPRWRRVEGDPLRRDPGHLEDLADVREGRLEEHLCGLGSRIDLPRVRVRIGGVDDEPSAPDPVPDLLGRVRREGGQHLRLHLDETAHALRLRPILRASDVPRPGRLQVEVAVPQRHLVVHVLHRGPRRLEIGRASC